jgi:class 3 adenylate cyclase
MADAQVRRFASPDEVIKADWVTAEIVDVGGIAVARNVHEPGFRWATHVRPVVGTEWCEVRHVGYAVRGSLHGITREGVEFVVNTGDVFHMTPGHDAWVVGDEPFVTIEWAGARSWLSPLHSLAERVLTTLVFTDIVDSTGTARRLGDLSWSDVIVTYEEGMRDVIGRFRGSEVKTTGDGVLAMFDGTARAIRCAMAMRDLAVRLGLETRGAVHVGEVEVAEGDLRGLAVHEAARIMAMGGPGDVLVSETARTLARDSSVVFEERGTHELRGLDGVITLYAVSSV